MYEFTVYLDGGKKIVFMINNLTEMKEIIMEYKEVIWSVELKKVEEKTVVSEENGDKTYGIKRKA